MLKKNDTNKEEANGVEGQEQNKPPKEARQKTRYEKYFNQVIENLRAKNERQRMLVQSVINEEEEARDRLFHPELGKNTTKIVDRKRKNTGDRAPIYKKVDQVLEDHKQAIKMLEKKINEERKEEWDKTCKFKPEVHEYRPITPSPRQMRFAKHKTDLNYDDTRARTPNGDFEKFLRKQQEYEQQKRIKMRLLADKQSDLESTKATFNPMTNTKSTKILNKARTRESSPINNIYNRLYKEQEIKEKNLAELTAQYNKAYRPFKPVINKSPVKASTAKDQQPERKSVFLDGFENAGASELNQMLQKIGTAGVRQSTPTKSILKNSQREDAKQSKPDPPTPNNLSTQHKTDKKVYIHDRLNSKTPDKLPTRSFIDKEGTVNIKFERKIIKDVLNVLNHY